MTVWYNSAIYLSVLSKTSLVHSNFQIYTNHYIRYCLFRKQQLQSRLHVGAIMLSWVGRLFLSKYWHTLIVSPATIPSRISLFTIYSSGASRIIAEWVLPRGAVIYIVIRVSQLNRPGWSLKFSLRSFIATFSLSPPSCWQFSPWQEPER